MAVIEDRINEIFNKWRGRMMNEGFGSPSSANAIDAETKADLTQYIANREKLARIDALTELLDELKGLEQPYNGPAGELARVSGKDSGLKYLRALIADFEDRIKQLKEDK